MGCGPSKETATAVMTNGVPLLSSENKPTHQFRAETSSVSSSSSAESKKKRDKKESSVPETKSASGNSSVSSNSTLTDEKNDSSNQVRVNFQIAPSVTEQRRIEWHVKPGYSSGASSIALDDEDVSISSDDGGEGSPVATPDSRSVNERLGSEENGASHHSDIVTSIKHDREASGCDLALSEAIVPMFRMETPFDTSIDKIYEGVLDGEVLGEGVAGIVRKVKHRATGVHFAVKCLDTGLIDTEEGLLQLRNEISIMCQLDHPNIVRIEECYESQNEIFIVQELCTGKELFDRLEEQDDYHYSEAQCAKLVKQMLSSVRYLHSHGIIHRDLKLENFLFSSSSPNSELKMIDFGLSKHFEPGQHHFQIVGTPYTVAPEIIRGDYDETVDIWALGVISYLLLSGATPFGGLDGESPLEVKDKIMRAQLDFEPKDVWDRVSEEGKAFVKRLLNQDPKKRPTARAVQKDPWIQVWAKKDAAKDGKLSSKTVDALIAFKESSEMQKLLSEVLAFTLLPEQIVELRKEFEKVEDGDGEVSLMTMKRVLMNSAETGGTLGTLKEKEIEGVFDSIKLRKAAPTIRWHEFLAAGLSQARIDDRNMRLAFDRLDSQRKGFLTVDDLSVVLGSSIEYEDLQLVWLASLKECNAHPSRITFADFKTLMNGQPKNTCSVQRDVSGISSLPAVAEGKREEAFLPSSMGTLASIQESSASTRESKKRARSRSHGVKSSFWDGDAKDARLPSLLSDHVSEKVLEAVEDRTLYRKRLDMRLAVVEASKRFDKKVLDIQSCASPNAGLVMRRAKEPVGDLAETVDAHTRIRTNASANKAECRPQRKVRRKTVSDVAGMF